MEILDSNLNEPSIDRRRDLLPFWIKICTWIFMFFGIMALVGIVFAVVGFPFQLSLYGLESEAPLSIIGITVTLLFVLKGVSAFGLWAEADWAIEVAAIDALIGILTCVFSMFSYLFDTEGAFEFRLELILLIPYLWQLNKIKQAWQRSAPAR